MSKPKETFTTYWVTSINSLLKKLNLETIQPEDFINLVIQNAPDTINITVICVSKILILNFDDTNKKLSGGWKHF